MTGRSPGISDVCCTTTLPMPNGDDGVWDTRVLPIAEDQNLYSSPSFALFFNSPTVSLKNALLCSHLPQPILKDSMLSAEYSQTLSEPLTLKVSASFPYAVDLSLLLRGVVGTLYAPGTMHRPWLEMELIISSLNTSADNWLSRVPVELDFTTSKTNDSFVDQRTGLAFQFYTTKLVILQPCLCRLAEWPPSRLHLSDLCKRLATECVQAAGHVINLLPEDVGAVRLNNIGLWCFTLHHIMRSTAVLLVELLTRTQPGTSEAAALTKKLRISLRLLKDRSEVDNASQKAWHICSSILSRHGSIFGFGDDEF
ncbi:hypothetical protein PENANT_c112G06856 [Penicillium antarcticum]|uniref:Transcription factor domain-containing protein n=1 Tax=Penicillium antarcticum TaxID=416450 RepID=A0A1V6PL37_9EURO|nr:hypothetical protein PENANT_c112G06856 [Penicillium antarcticum]